MPGLHETILKAVVKDVPGLPADAVARTSASPFAPGVKDHRSLEKGEKLDDARRESELGAIEKAVRAAAATREPSDEAIAALEAALDVADPILIADEAVDRISALDLADFEPVFDALRTVALATARPQALKLCIALLAPYEEPETIPFFALLSRHPEYSLYATTALANDASPRARAELVALLDWTTGLAKKDVIERLLRVEDLEIPEVLLAKAMIGIEPHGAEIALGVAERCDLAGAFADRGLTRDLFTGGCQLLAALAEDGLDDYSGRDDAVAAFVERLADGAADLDTAETAAAIMAWGKRSKAKLRSRPAPKLNSKRRGKEKRPVAHTPTPLDAAEEASAYLTRPDVSGAIVADLVYRDPVRRVRAARLAAAAHLDDARGPLLEAAMAKNADDAVIAAALSLADAAGVGTLRDVLVPRLSLDARTGAPEALPVLDARSGSVDIYCALLAALPRAPEAASRALLRAATGDRDPRVRRAAFRAMRALSSPEPADRDALARAAKDPAPEIAGEAHD